MEQKAPSPFNLPIACRKYIGPKRCDVDDCQRGAKWAWHGTGGSDFLACDQCVDRAEPIAYVLRKENLKRYLDSRYGRTEPASK